jgi:hypothetical protein
MMSPFFHLLIHSDDDTNAALWQSGITSTSRRCNEPDGTGPNGTGDLDEPLER